MHVSPVVALTASRSATGPGCGCSRTSPSPSRPGEFVAIAGPNGGGKTTLLRLVLGLERPTAGTVRVDPAARVGYLPQRTRLVGEAPVTVREVVSTGRLAPAGIWGPLRAVDRSVVAHAIERVGLADRADAPLRTLSGGMQQRALIAKALAAEPTLLALDEPTTGVDAASQESLGLLLGELREELGVTILYVSHEFGAVEHVVDRIVLVRGGIVYDGPPSGLPGVWHDPSHDHATAMLDLEFMRLALATGAIVGLLAPAVGFFLVERKASLIGDGLGHVAFAGVALGYLLGISPVLTALVAAVVGALTIEWLRSRGGAAGDQALALVFYTGIAAGVVLVSRAGALNVNLFQFLFGSILTVTRNDLWTVIVLGIGALVTIALLFRGLVATVLDEEGSRVAGVPVTRLNVVVAVLAALTVAVSMRIVGILLIAALMVLPVIAANRVAWSLRSTFGLSMAFGFASVIAGLVISYYADTPPGGTIVLVAAGAFAVCAAGSAFARRA